MSHDIAARVEVLTALMREQTRGTGGDPSWDEGLLMLPSGLVLAMVVDHRDGTHGAIVWRRDSSGWIRCGDEFATSKEAYAAADAALSEEGWL